MKPPFFYPHSQKHSIQPCGVNPKCNGSVCEFSEQSRGWVSLGTVQGASLNLNNDEVVVQIGGTNTSSCEGSSEQRKTAEIRFVCDMSLTECTGNI